MNPVRLSAVLRSISDRIDASKRPSRTLVAAELRRVLAAMDPGSVSVEDLKSMLVAQVHAFDPDAQEYVSADIRDKVALADRFLRSHGIKVIDLTGRDDIPAALDPESAKVAVDLHFIDGDKTVMVDPGPEDSGGIKSFVDSILDGVYAALKDSGERLPPELSSPFEPDHHDVSLSWDGSSFVPESDE